jgi:hypothetical protein
MKDRSNCNSVLVWANRLVVALGIVMMLGPTSNAASLRRGANSSPAATSGQGTFFSAYFSLGTGSTLDNPIKLENPTAANGNMCAMIYVFDTTEELGECCGCLLTPNQIRYGSVKQLIGSNWLGELPTQGVIQIVSAVPNNLGQPNQCLATQNYIPTPTLNGWITHVQTVASISGLTEVSFTDNGSADPTEANYLLNICAIKIGNASGGGVCTCPTSDESGGL